MEAIPYANLSWNWVWCEDLVSNPTRYISCCLSRWILWQSVIHSCAKVHTNLSTRVGTRAGACCTRGAYKTYQLRVEAVRGSHSNYKVIQGTSDDILAKQKSLQESSAYRCMQPKKVV
eukprot:6184152-Pleurochrysis_carterae.AAC.1